MSITYIYDTTEFFRYSTPEAHVTVVTPPASEPVSTDLFYAHTQTSYTTDQIDSLASAYITAARGWCETYCNRSFPTQTLKLTLDRFPCDSGSIHLKRAPAQSVTSVQYIDANGNEQTLDPDLYFVDLNPIAPRISLLSGNSWPTTIDRVCSVSITYVAGYAAVPQEVVNAILMVAGDLWANRFQQQTMSEGGQLFKNPTVEVLLSTYRTF